MIVSIRYNRIVSLSSIELCMVSLRLELGLAQSRAEKKRRKEKGEKVALSLSDTRNESSGRERLHYERNANTH